MAAPDAPPEPRDTGNESLRRELEVLKPELQLIKSEVRWLFLGQCGSRSMMLTGSLHLFPGSHHVLLHILRSRPQAQRCVTELKAQVNRLEAEVDEQRTHKQMAMVENEHLRMEVEALRTANVANVGAQIGFKEADGESALASRWRRVVAKH